MLQVRKSQLIEVILPQGSTTTTLQFPDQPYLRDKKIWGLEIVTNNDMTKSPQNNDVIDTATAKKSYLTLYLNNPEDPTGAMGQWIQLVPFALLHRVQNSATDPFVRTPYLMAGQKVSWDKCQIQFPTALTPPSTISFLIQVYFTDK
jgi:hypothetical protein